MLDVEQTMLKWLTHDTFHPLVKAHLAATASVTAHAFEKPRPFDSA